MRPNIRALSPYSTARDEFKGEARIFVDANESAYNNGYNRYPDPGQKKLKKVVAELEGVDVLRLFLGNGSDEAIDLLFRIFCTPGVDNAVTVQPTYGMYGVAADINDIAVRTVPLEKDFSLDVDRLLATADSQTKLILLCSPNNPTGNSIPLADISCIADSFAGIVVVDEAYIHYSPYESAVSLMDDYNNIVVLRTLSKGRAMAGLRVGMAIADPVVVRTMSNVKYPYNISQATIDKALELLAVTDSASQIETTVAERSRLADELAKLPIIKEIFPSDANFLLVRVPDPDGLYDYLAGLGRIVRNRNSVPGCRGCLRITVGLPEENDSIIKAISEYEKETAHN